MAGWPAGRQNTGEFLKFIINQFFKLFAVLTKVRAMCMHLSGIFAVLSWLLEV